MIYIANPTGGAGGGVSNIATGTGLTGGPITTTGTIALATNIAPIATLGTALQYIRVNAGATALEYATLGSGGDMVLASAQTNTGAKTFNATTLLLRNVAGTFNGSFTNTNSADRIYTLPNAAGTIALTSDITGINSGTNTGDNTVCTSGAATTAVTLLTARTIAGVSFNGSANITIAATNLSDTALLARLASPTFTGTVVLPNSQALVTPVLGTPTSVTLTNATGLPTAGLVNNAVTNAKMATMTTKTYKGNTTAGTADPTDVPVATLKTDLGLNNVDNTSNATERAATATLTNKRNQPRTNSTTTAGTLAPDLSSANVYFRTTQTATLTVSAPIGTPVIGEVITIYVDSVAAQTLTIDATYVAFGAAFPATTTAGKTFMMTAMFNGTNYKTTWANQM